MLIDTKLLEKKLEQLEKEDYEKEEYYRLHSTEKDWDKYKDYTFQAEWDLIRDKKHILSNLISYIEEAKALNII